MHICSLDRAAQCYTLSSPASPLCVCASMSQCLSPRTIRSSNKATVSWQVNHNKVFTSETSYISCPYDTYVQYIIVYYNCICVCYYFICIVLSVRRESCECCCTCAAVCLRKNRTFAPTTTTTTTTARRLVAAVSTFLSSVSTDRPTDSAVCVIVECVNVCHRRRRRCRAYDFDTTQTHSTLRRARLCALCAYFRWFSFVCAQDDKAHVCVCVVFVCVPYRMNNRVYK